MRNPFAGLTDKLTENNRLMEQWMAGYNTGRESSERSEQWSPAVDIFMRQNRDMVVLAELPGVHKEDIDISLAGGDLTICGEKDGREQEAEYYTAERYTGSFKRTITLPDGLTEDRISCNFDGCMLEVVIHDYHEILEQKRLEIADEES